MAAMKPSSTPRWVKVFGIVAAVLVVLVVILLLTGNHGPGRHISAGIQFDVATAHGVHRS
jgi:hypothetical protein